MILHTAQIIKMDYWLTGEDVIINGMRNQLANLAYARGLELGNEVIEIVHMKQDGFGVWRSAKELNATHVKVTVEQEAAHP